LAIIKTAAPAMLPVQPQEERRRSGAKRKFAKGCTVARVGGETEVNIFSADMARSLFLKRLQQRHRPLAGLLYSVLGRRVMIVADGDEWRRTHEALMPSFTPAYVMKHYAPVMWAIANETFDHVASCPGDPPSVEAEVEPLIRALLARVMGFVIFGRCLSMNEGVELHRRLDVITQVIDRGDFASINWAFGIIRKLAKPSHWQRLSVPRVKREAVAELLLWIEQKIEAARCSGQLSAVVEALETRFEHLHVARKRYCVATECAMLFIAGIETTGAAVTFALAEIANNPSLQACITNEARSQKSGNLNAIEQFPLIHRVLMETLRRHTVVPTMLREAAADDVIMTGVNSDNSIAPIAIKRGSVLRYFLIHGHLRRDIWTSPYRFDPERFRNSLTREQQKNYNPFGLGPQICIGRNMALLEATIALSSLFQRLDVEAKKILKPFHVQRNAVFTYRPVGVTLRFVVAGSERSSTV
jgi:cytochrome P450